jgi:CheY-like chemotaxis protein
MDTPQSKNRLLLVDGDPKSLRVLDVSLKKAGFDVTTASSGREAFASLEAELPDLIISDTDLDEMDGFELCRRIKSKPEWAKIPFLFVSGRKSIEDKIRGLELGVDDYLTKPIYIKEIGIRVRTALQRAERERMESRRDGRTRFAGALSDVGVVDLVQTIELNRKSGIIHIVNRDGRRGSIFFRDGKVIDAEVGRLSGAQALYRLFSWSDGQFAVEFKHIRRHDVIGMSVAALLMEGMRRLDESTHLLESLPGTNHVLEVDCRVLAEELAELPDEVNSVLRLCDGARTLQEVVEDSDHPDLETLSIISKLFLGQIIFAREAPEHGGESEPGVRLANWLSEGGAEAPASAPESRAPSPPAKAGQAVVADEVLPAPVAALVPAAEKVLSAEENLGAVLPSRVDATDPARGELARAADTLKGVPVEGLFAEKAPRPASEAPAAVATQAGAPRVMGGDEQRPTKPLGLAERLLSGDSTLRAVAMHEAIIDGDGRVKEPMSSDRHTHPYGDPATEAAVALVQEVVSSTHGSASQVPPPLEPERPKKEVDWGAWPAISPLAPASAASAPASEKAAAGETSAAKPRERKPSGAELDASDLEEVEPSDVLPANEKPAAVRVGSAAATGDDETAMRLEAADVLPVEPERPSGTAQASVAPGHVDSAARTSTGSPRLGIVAAVPASGDDGSGPAEGEHEQPRARDSSSLRPLWNTPEPTSSRRIWLLIVAAFVLGMVGFLVLGRRAMQPDQPNAAASSASAVTAPPSAAPPQEPAAKPKAEPLAEAAKPAAAGPEPLAEAAKPAAAGPEPGTGAATAPDKKSASLGLGAAAALPDTSELRQKCLDTNADGKGKAKAVSTACRPVLEADPKDAEVMVILARVEIDRGRLGEARSLAKRALAADPQRHEAYVYLGTAEQAAGKVEEARAAYKKYLELAPDGPFARELRAILSNL